MNAYSVNDTTFEEAERLTRSLKKRQLHAFAKRLFDVIVATALVLALLPVLTVLALTVKFSSPGPVIFRQERIGQGGNIFQMFKFRSMYTEVSPEMAKKLQQHQDAGILLKGGQDPRVTLVGHWLRRTSLDELPQLFNVIGGSMSLVGPRPLMPHLARPYPNFVMVRSMLKPGITGLWQVRDREHCTSAAFMIRHDLEYVENYGFFVDLKIILLTLPALLGTKGAC